MKIMLMNNKKGRNLKPIIVKRYFYWNVLLLTFPALPIDRRTKYSFSDKHCLRGFFTYKLKT